MNKIKQARAWLAKKERTDVEKRGDDNINKIVWIGVVIIVLGLVAGVLIFLVNTLGDDAAEEAANITTQDAAVYDADCEGVNIGRIGVILAPAAAANQTVQLAYDANTGYLHPNGTAPQLFAANASTTAIANGLFKLAGTPATTDRVAFLHSVSDVTEARFNADFNGDGTIDAGQVVALLTTAAATPGTNVASNTDGAPAMITADPGANINVRVGSNLVLDRRAGCWGVKV